jgi:hypothetical protein
MVPVHTTRTLTFCAPGKPLLPDILLAGVHQQQVRGHTQRLQVPAPVISFVSIFSWWLVNTAADELRNVIDCT